jgi:pimeloyl-ACP methyl ester carboxylesterase
MKRLLKVGLLTIILLSLVISVSYFIIASKQETKALDKTAAPGKFIKLKGGLTHYEQLGPLNGKPIVFIHGGGITGMEVWKQNSLFFAEQSFSVLTYDLFGRGYSDRVEAEYTPERLLHQFTELIDSLKITTPFTLVSMSMGSMIALDYANQFPDKVQSVIMIDPAITGDYKPNALLKLPIISDLLMTLYWYPRSVDNQQKEFVDQLVYKDYAMRLQYFMNFEGYKKMNYVTWMHTLNQSRLELLGNIERNKVILIYGNSDPYFPAANVENFMRLYPTLQVHEIYGAGHMPHLERPKEVNEIILNHLLGQNSHTNPPQE